MNLEKLFTIVLVLLPILDIYAAGTPSISLGKMLLLVISIVLLIQKKGRLQFYKEKFFLLFLLAVCFLPLFFNIFDEWFSFSVYLRKLIAVIGFYLTLCLALRYTDWNVFFKCLRTVILVCCIFFLIQFFLLNFFGYHLLGIIPGIPLAGEMGNLELIERQENLDRVSSFFREPAHFAQFVSIYYILIAFKKENPFSDFEFLLLSVILLISQSGYGQLVLLIVIATLLFRMVFSKKHFFKNFFLAIVVAVVGVVAFNFVSNSELFNDNLSRVDELSAKQENTRGSSGYQRIYAGYNFISDIEPSKRVLGIGLGSQNAYYATHYMPHYSTVATNTESSVYLNSFQLALTWGGVLGGLFYILFCFSIFKGNTITGKVLIGVFFVTGFMSSGMFSSQSMLFSMLLSIYFKRKQMPAQDSLKPLQSKIRGNSLYAKPI